MKRPEMILFDYGHTLGYSKCYSDLRGAKAMMPHITKNPDDLSAEQIADFRERMFEKTAAARNAGFEIHEWQILRLSLEYLGLETDLDEKDYELMFWKAASEGAAVDGIGKFLDFLKENKIRTGVVSNIGWSGRSLTQRINEFIPQNDFEFIIASSEYGIRKPDKMIFDLALKKAGLTPEKVWYCGDSIEFDIIGAHNAGLFPVLYDDPMFRTDGEKELPDFEYLHISAWEELRRIIEEMPL